MNELFELVYMQFNHLITGFVYLPAPEVQLKVTSPNRTLVEGDDVDVSCVSDPPAESYSLSCARVSLKQ